MLVYSQRRSAHLKPQTQRPARAQAATPHLIIIITTQQALREHGENPSSYLALQQSLKSQLCGMRPARQQKQHSCLSARAATRALNNGNLKRLPLLDQLHSASQDPE